MAIRNCLRIFCLKCICKVNRKPTQRLIAKTVGINKERILIFQQKVFTL